jgi:predicted PurR-regulated permease PerM
MEQMTGNESPKWNWTTKLILGIGIMAVFAWLILRLRDFMGPMIIAFILIFLSYPVAGSIKKLLHIPWRVAVTIWYLLLVVIILGLLTWGGLAIIEQSQSLFNLVQQAATVTIPDYINHLSTQVFTFGRYQIDMSKDLKSITDQALATIQPLLGQVGNLLTRVAGSAATFLGWLSFIMLVSYFITSESGGSIGNNLKIDIPGYAADIRRLYSKLERIWSTFLRGQFILFLLTVAAFFVVLSIYGVHYALGLALISGLGRFLPYIGPLVAWLTLGLVAFFQGYTIFGLTPLGYVILVVLTAVLIDSAFDNIISPTFLGSTLKVHPAAVLVTALIAANVIGLIGVLVAAPVLATITVLGRYMLRKMFDMDPWAGVDETPEPPSEMKFPNPQIITAWQWLRKNVPPLWVTSKASVSRFFTQMKARPPKA